ncbi:uncharacterized protein LOC133321170 [Musca vetustissima]|uniref:uncharacterized protein LOC133321170 n=1 Tax=Musca vetustissima TaxID=27455 RepID=UPI002AB6C099|nr:uncharacterized protein LOC133321170 [Musca vetustissima]
MHQLKTWTAEVKSVDVFSSNPELMNFVDFKVERIERGIYGFSGNIVFNFDIAEGDSNEMESQIYFSSNGKDNYRKTPFHIYRQHDYKILATFYKDVAMEEFKTCSNMPQFEGEFVPPLAKDTYYMDKCQFDMSGFPNHLQDGFYKIEVTGFGDVDWSMVFVFKVERDI